MRGVHLLGFALGVVMITTGLVAQTPAPQPSESTQLRLEVVALKQQLSFALAQAQVCQGQLAPAAYKNTMDTLALELAALRDTFEQEHPGWTLDAQGRPVTKGGS